MPEARKELLHAIYERIVVAGRSFVKVKLTTAAYNHGLALAMPEAALARPEGVGRARTTTPRRARLDPSLPSRAPEFLQRVGACRSACNVTETVAA